MNLVIDQGNTVTKLAVFDAGRLISRVTEPVLNLGILKKFCGSYTELNSAILSSVSVYEEDIPEFLGSSYSKFIVLTSSTPIPITNKYESAETLGVDRIADAVGAFTIFPGNNLLIIDAGTAITIDLVTATGEFYGGNISPGLELRLRALHEFTNKLPKVDKQDDFPLLGKNTNQAILAGVLNGVVFEIDGYIGRLRQEYPDLKSILTGGDIKFFDGKLKNSIFVHSNLNLTGLNRILEFNAEK